MFGCHIVWSCCVMEKKIYSDEEVFEQIKPVSRKAYVKAWKGFKDLAPDFNFEEGPPGEEIIVSYFRYLRFEKKVASTSLWTFYSYVNSILKRKYGFKLQELPRVTMLIKGFEEDVKKKAAIFDETLLKKFMVKEMESAYWEVRQAVVILAYFGGLRNIECLQLRLEKITRAPEGYIVTHKRAKQRTDATFTRFLVPQEGGYADRVAIYLNKVNTQLDKFAGRVWYTGTKNSHLKKQGMGRNSLYEIPHLMAKIFNMPEDDYTFHSFRRTAATNAADAGSTTEQLVDFFGWKNGSMCQEYISSSKHAIKGMASKLGAFEQILSQDPVVEVDVEMEEAKEVAQEDPLKEMEFIVMEEDPEMYAMAGIELVSVPVPVPAFIESTIRQAMASVPNLSGATVNIKIVTNPVLHNCNNVSF